MPETWAQWMMLGAAAVCGAAVAAFLLAHLVTSERLGASVEPEANGSPTPL
jgi:hypothetical protein